MKLALQHKYIPSWAYIGKVIATATLYYTTSRLSDVVTFIHPATQVEFQAFWAPSGFALGMILLFGRSMWPGILLASLIRTPIITTVVGGNVEMLNAAILSLTIAAGRVIEPLVGSLLIDRFLTGDRSLNSLSNTLRFIVIALLISVIGAGISTSIIQFFRQDPYEIFISRLIGWYINNAFGVLLFTPFIISIFQVSKLEPIAKKKIIIQTLALLTFVSLFVFIKPETFIARAMALKVFYLFTIPMLLLLAFRFHLIISSLALVSLSSISVYFTSLDIGPFVLDTISDSSILLKLFMVTASLSTMLAFAASNERRVYFDQIEERARQLKKTSEIILGTMDDLKAERSKAEESDKLKSSFLANISHEVRTPMNAIVGFSELLNRENLDPKKRREFTQLIRQRSKDLLVIVNDILDISKIESGQMVTSSSVGNIEELLLQLFKNISAEVNHIHRKQIDIKISNGLKGNENLVIADFARLHQVFTNLLHNALKFTEKGSIEFGCQRKDEQTLLFYVRDTGIGIDVAKQEMIFGRFQQASADIHQKYGGTGLGLAIVKGLINLWNGEIWVVSEKGKGSTFFFTMPYLPKQNKFEQKTNRQLDN